MFISRTKRSTSGKNQQGFTLLELLAVTALIAAVIFAGLKIKRSAEIRTTAATLTNNMNVVNQKVAEIYPTSFTGLSCVTLINNGAFTGTSFIVDRTVPATPTVAYSSEAGSTLTCAPGNVTGTNDGYAITFPALSNDMCNEVAEKLNGSAWVMTINGTNIKAARGALDSATKGAQCNATATDNAQVLVASFTRALPPQ